MRPLCRTSCVARTGSALSRLGRGEEGQEGKLDTGAHAVIGGNSAELRLRDLDQCRNSCRSSAGMSRTGCWPARPPMRGSSPGTSTCCPP